MARTYDDPCGVARALDLVGDRWALLVVRELLLGPKRFSELRRGLPGAGQSMLTQRLAELERAGVLRRRQLGPPASAQVYELTDRGLGLEPVLLALGRWGSRTPMTSTAALSVDALALAMRTTFDATAAGTLAARCELRLDGDILLAEVGEGRFTLTRGPAQVPDAVIETSATVFRRLIFGGSTLAAAEDAGLVTVRGNREAADRLLTVFPRPRAEAAPAP
ncbi:winged helix-turn-helix transcriptional regulator [Actinoplanes auranticolor]|uniref:Transcriptional regulator n=1 Tax=Actinoplanes auranticolor TaxID=47988 RepID=A0A919VGK0_9ACTN|nr:helix-turn-helix domain-containing protein [Actinoplanes auranticolor]GIM64042.1 transcriptional regulator [Actinoplanes auranticolor]